MIKHILPKISDYNSIREFKKYAPLLKKDSAGLKADELVDLLYSARWERFFWIKQLPNEIKGLVRHVESIEPRVVVEIGTNMGGSLFCFTKVARSDAHIISIDLPGGMGGGGYPEKRTEFYRSFIGPTQRMDLLRADSHEIDSLEKLKTILKGEAIDFLFLDGDHSYEGIKMDFEMYSPLVRSGGLVAFHDIKPSLPDNWRQVGPYWEELKNNYKHHIYWDDIESWGGIGVLEMP